jgi:hypothetical protein
MPFFVKGEKIVLKKDGTWVADGIEITHGETRDTFFRSIHKDTASNQYYLEIGYERMFIEVEDTPYFVTAIDDDHVLLSNTVKAPLKPDSLHYKNGNLYFQAPDGEQAKFLSAPYYDLLKSLSEDHQFYYVTVKGLRINLSPKTARRTG